MTLSDFRARFPEFRTVPDAMVTATMVAALLELHDAWGDIRDEGQAYLTAHKLALSPYGTGTKLQTKNGSTTYFAHYAALRDTIGGGGMLL